MLALVACGGGGSTRPASAPTTPPAASRGHGSGTVEIDHGSGTLTFGTEALRFTVSSCGVRDRDPHGAHTVVFELQGSGKAGDGEDFAVHAVRSDDSSSGERLLDDTLTLSFSSPGTRAGQMWEVQRVDHVATGVIDEIANGTATAPLLTITSSPSRVAVGSASAMLQRFGSPTKTLGALTATCA
jgi:hypothetical protein